MAGIKGDFTGFTFKGIHSSSLGITRVSGGDRYSLSLLPSAQDKTGEVVGANKVYYFGTNEKQREFALNLAFDSLSESDLRKITRLFSDYTPGALIFDESPYKYYNAKVNGDLKFDFVCFDDANGNRVYKGESSISLIAYDPIARGRFKFLDQYNKTSIPIWDDDNGNISQWSSTIQLLDSQGDVDKLFYNLNTIDVYNPGDKEAPFKVYILGVYNQSTLLYDYNFKLSIVEDSTKQLVVYGSSYYPVLCVDMGSHLILTCDAPATYAVDADGLFYKDGSNYTLRSSGTEAAPFYNAVLSSISPFVTEDFFYAGNYFKLNLSLDTDEIYTLQLSTGVNGETKGKMIGIEYNYLFY